MPRVSRAGLGARRPHLSTAQVGRQLRAAFEPVPTGNDDFADLLAQLDAVERKVQRQAAE
jgi:hypothetical protein